MKIIMLNGPKGTGKDEAAKAFVNAARRKKDNDLGIASVWPYKALVHHYCFDTPGRSVEKQRATFLQLEGDPDYIVIADCYSPDCGVKEAIALVGPSNVCVVNVYRDGYGWSEDEGTWFAAANGNVEQEFELYNNGGLDELGGALARIVEAWELGEMYVQVYTGRPN